MGRQQRRARPVQQERLRVLVVTEGTSTEPQYVELLQQFLRDSGPATTVKSVGVGKDPLKVVQACVVHRDQAKGRDKPFDLCVCLVDVDTHSLLESARVLAGREGISLLVSNVKFEVWLRWHREESCSALTSRQLDEFASTAGLLDGKSLARGFPIERVHEACVVARRADPDLCAGRVGPDPSSALPVLVDVLSGSTPSTS